MVKDFSAITPKYTLPSLRLGGVAIVIAFLAGLSLIQLLGEITPIKAHYFWGFLASLSIIAAVSLFSTFRALDFRLKLAGQLAAIAAVMAAGIVIEEFHLPWIGWAIGGWWVYPLTLLWILGLTNAYNRMDKLDGLSASTAVIASAFLSYIAFQHESVFVYLGSVALFGASFGFLIFNWPPAKIFIGDIGSTFLGFSFAVMAIVAGLYDRSHTSLLVVPLLLFHFIFDSAFTAVARHWYRPSEVRGDRGHLYELLGVLGYSLRGIVLLYCAMALLQGIGALWMVAIPGSNRIWIFVLFVVLQAGYAGWVVWRAKSMGLV